MILTTYLHMKLFVPKSGLVQGLRHQSLYLLLSCCLYRGESGLQKKLLIPV